MGGKKNKSATTKLNLSHELETCINMTRCDLIFNSHKFAHNYATVSEPTVHVVPDLRLQSTCSLIVRYLTIWDYFNSLYRIDLVQNLANSNNTKKIDILLYGDEGLPYMSNRLLFAESAVFIKSAVDIYNNL
jgi:hypothetical protein